MIHYFYYTPNSEINSLGSGLGLLNMLIGNRLGFFIHLHACLQVFMGAAAQLVADVRRYYFPLSLHHTLKQSSTRYLIRHNFT